MEGRGRPATSGPVDGDGRRSLYINVRRNFLTPFFLAFDFPTPFTTMGRRSSSNVPAQALTMMNNPLVIQQAAMWSTRTAGQPADDRIRTLYEAAFSRPPSPDEMAAAAAFIESQSHTSGETTEQAWADLCHVLLNTKEFVFIE
uniref:PSD1 n=1 Tax=uncultured Planctomyces sp. TaxID=179110 RepID=A0A060BQ16_9PLAN|nr:PSD1 [uncultured Planctomyces sp.]